MTKVNQFDGKAKEWDLDPAKRARAELFAHAILTNTPEQQRISGLEYGCGTGIVSFKLQPYFKELLLVDTSQGMLEVVVTKKKALRISNVTPLLSDLSEAPAVTGRYEVIYTLMTLHHVRNINRLLHEFASLLPVDGHLFIADLDKEDGSFHGKGFDGHHGIDRNELEKMLLQEGFVQIDFTTMCHVNRTSDDGRAMEYPIFLMKCRKPR